MRQEEINELRKRLDARQNLPAPILPAAAGSQVPVVPLASPSAQHLAASDLHDSAPVKAPLAFELGGATLTPTGFIDFSPVWRSETVTSGLPTNFAAIPFNNTVLGHRRQTISTAHSLTWNHDPQPSWHHF